MADKRKASDQEEFSATKTAALAHLYQHALYRDNRGAFGLGYR